MIAKFCNSNFRTECVFGESKSEGKSRGNIRNRHFRPANHPKKCFGNNKFSKSHIKYTFEWISENN